MRMGLGFIDDNFGTTRGLVRLALSYDEVALRLAGIVKPKPAEVRRLVFVCHGNICRSAFADVIAQQAGFNVASFGLSTSEGKPAHPPVIEVAAAMGHDLTAHRTTRAQDFLPLKGDLLLGMETRHLRKIAKIEALAPFARSLLGLWCDPRFPHLHDPYQLGDAYLKRCLARIEQSVERLMIDFPGARISAA